MTGWLTLEEDDEGDAKEDVRVLEGGLGDGRVGGGDGCCKGRGG